MKIAEETLYCRDSRLNMDKEYRAFLYREGADEYHLYFAWGRRGKNLQFGKRKVYRSERSARLAMKFQLDTKRGKGYASSEERDNARTIANSIKEANAREARGEKRWPTMPDKPRRKRRRFVEPARAAMKKQLTKPPAILGGARRIKLDD